MPDNVTQTPILQNPAFAGHSGLSCKGHFDVVSGFDEGEMPIDVLNLLLQSNNRTNIRAYNKNNEQNEDSEENVEIANNKAMAKMARAYSRVELFPYEKSEIFSFAGHDLNYKEIKEASETAEKDLNKEIEATKEEMVVENNDVAISPTTGRVMTMMEMMRLEQRNPHLVKGHLTTDDVVKVDGEYVSKEEYQKLQALEEKSEKIQQFNVQAQSLAEKVANREITPEEAQKQLEASTDPEILALMVSTHEEIDQNLPTDIAAADIPLESPEQPVKSLKINNVAVADVTYTLNNTPVPKF